MQPNRPQQQPPYPPPQQWGPPPRPPKRTSPAVIVLAVIGGVLGLLLVIGGAAALLGSGEPTGTADPPASSAATGPAAGSALAALGIPPTPDPKAWAAYITALKAIDPDIVGDKDEARIIGRGRDQCGSIKEWPDDEAKLIDLTNQRFTAPGHSGGFGEAKAKRILAAVRKHICPTY